MIGDKKFKDIIAEQYEKKENLNELDRLYPTLTIFVPTLPMNGFLLKNGIRKQKFLKWLIR